MSIALGGPVRSDCHVFAKPVRVFSSWQCGFPIRAAPQFRPPSPKPKTAVLLRHECGMPPLAGQSLLPMPFAGPLQLLGKAALRPGFDHAAIRFPPIFDFGNAVQPVGSLAGTPHRNPFGDSARVNFQNSGHFVTSPGGRRLRWRLLLGHLVTSIVVVWRNPEIESFWRKNCAMSPPR